jgi:hypothetical protein
MTIDKPMEHKRDNLRIWNFVVGLILVAQAIIMALLTHKFSLLVTATFTEGPPESAATLNHFRDIQTGRGAFTFMAISALALLTIAYLFGEKL